MNDDTRMVSPKGIWRREEIPIGDWLLSYKNALTEEFMAGFSTLEEAATKMGHATVDRPNHKDGDYHYGNLVQSKVEGKNFYRPNIESWKNVAFKYILEDANNNIRNVVTDNHPFAKRFPTAYGLLKELGDDCPIMNYSILAPHSSIFRHTGIENREGRFIRIHIPLIVPEGDIFLEVNAEEIKWDDLFGFNNQLPHSAHNLSSEWRMIFLVDIDRERAGLTPGEPFNPKYRPKMFNRKLM